MHLLEFLNYTVKVYFLFHRKKIKEASAWNNSTCNLDAHCSKANFRGKRSSYGFYKLGCFNNQWKILPPL